jgi:DNA invertase Pin-like site-specific DNA recombinase
LHNQIVKTALADGHRPDHQENSRHAAIYARAAVAGRAILVQREACQAWAEARSYTVPDAYLCLDDGCSGLTLERLGLQRLRELIRTRAIEAVIVLDLARLSRNVSHLLLLTDECAHADVAVHAVLSPRVPILEAFRGMRYVAEAKAEEGGVTR